MNIYAMTTGRFYLDSFQYFEVEGEHDPSLRWNGFAVPWFTLEQALLIANTWNNMEDDLYKDSKAYYCPHADTFTFYCSASDTTEVFHAEIVNGQTLYPVGARSWVWSVVQ